jgi:hypothetical protein
MAHYDLPQTYSRSLHAGKTGAREIGADKPIAASKGIIDHVKGALAFELGEELNYDQAAKNAVYTVLAHIREPTKEMAQAMVAQWLPHARLTDEDAIKLARPAWHAVLDAMKLD